MFIEYKLQVVRVINAQQLKNAKYCGWCTKIKQGSGYQYRMRYDVWEQTDGIKVAILDKIERK